MRYFDDCYEYDNQADQPDEDRFADYNYEPEYEDEWDECPKQSLDDEDMIWFVLCEQQLDECVRAGWGGLVDLRELGYELTILIECQGMSPEQADRDYDQANDWHDYTRELRRLVGVQGTDYGMPTR